MGSASPSTARSGRWGHVGSHVGSRMGGHMDMASHMEMGCHMDMGHMDMDMDMGPMAHGMSHPMA
eukprot:5605788-Prymnesium_polylepis.1